MSKAITVGYVISFIIVFGMVFDSTINRIYPDERELERSSAYSMLLPSNSDTSFPVRSIVFYFVYVVAGLSLIYLSFKSILSPVLSNMLGWAGFMLFVSGNYFLKFPSWTSIIYGSAVAPEWTLIVQWAMLAVLFYFAYIFAIMPVKPSSGNPQQDL